MRGCSSADHNPFLCWVPSLGVGVKMTGVQMSSFVTLWIIHKAKSTLFCFFNRGPFLNESIFFSQVSKKQTTKQTRLLLSFAGQWAVLFYLHGNGSSDFKQSSGRTCTKHINYLPRAEYCKLWLWLSIKEWCFLPGVMQCSQSNRRLHQFISARL